MNMSKRRIGACFALVAGFFFSATCFAVEPDSATQLAQLYFVRGNSPDSWADLLATTTVLSARSELKSVLGHEPTQSDLRRATEVAKRSIIQTIPRAEWERAMSAVFRKYMTEEDLSKTLEFYRTSAGRKLLRIQVETGVEAGQALAEILRAREDTLGPLFYKLLAEEFLQSPAE